MNSSYNECERKFIVTNDDFKSLSTHHFFIRQGYLCKDEERSVRIRLLENRAFLTIKGKTKTHAFTHFEWEKEIKKEEGDQLLQLCLPPYIEKIRWIVPINDTLQWEIDEFQGRLAGLIIAEIELENENMPTPTASFIGEEVTFDKHYYNINL